ncbi:hypothetical protein FB45DRAFT_916291 [Roridomyces roridus]|uniref:Uncharacterized protein n=1 Tax=Roridomyces roridus TaxID=1738132 RepID=A0AAD7BTY4_9AGAR|nr:hypothetical protein FB45DRAFT_916291 [Roridomyces roridus]
MALPRTTLIIIICVASAVVGTILLLVLYRLFLHRPPAPVPLPPKQELARYREQSTHGLWHDPHALSVPSLQFAASKSSLTYPDSPGRHPVRNPSFIMSESPSEDMSQLGTPQMEPSALQIPHLPFDTSSTSLSTSESSPSDSSHPHSRSPSSSTRPKRRGRPLSVGSTSSSALSRNTGRHQGSPHGPFSQVQIVLPAPLAFSESSRPSVVDQWTPRVVRSEQRRSSSSSEPRKSTSLSQPPINAWHTQRAASASNDYIPPPVPRIPEQWKSSPDSSERTGEMPPPVDRPPGQRRLQRRSRSTTAV